MKTCVCYGGPLHGDTLNIDGRTHRIEAVAPYMRRRVSLCPENIDMPVMPAFQRVSYYLNQYMLNGRTAAGATVYKSLYVLLFEGSPLSRHEEFDLERDMEKLPWQWSREPSFLYQFDQWWEKKVHEHGIQKVQVYW